jgi:hypothetical protein
MVMADKENPAMKTRGELLEELYSAVKLWNADPSWKTEQEIHKVIKAIDALPL